MSGFFLERTPCFGARAAMAGAVIAVCCWGAPAAKASSVNVNAVPPEIHASQVEVSYDAALDRLTANGLVQTFDQGGTSALSVLSQALFSLSAAIGDDGTVQGGTFKITGKLTQNGPVQTLLSGTVSAVDHAVSPYGFSGTPGGTFDPLDFQIEPTSGILKSFFPQESSIRLSGSGFPGTWDNPFSNRAEFGGPYGQADVYAPLPSAVWLLGSGLALILSLGRRRTSV